MDNSTGACISPRSDGLEESTDRFVDFFFFCLPGT